MFRRFLAAALAAGFAFAPVGSDGAEKTSQCPEQLKKVDALLRRNPKLPADEMAKAKKLRDQGEVLMKGGKAKECRIALNRAEKMLAKGLK